MIQFEPIITLGGLGILFGLSLAYAAKKFYIPLDPKLEKVISALPGANCGACGKAGCMGFAEALSKGELDLNSCTLCDSKSREAIAKILDLSLQEKVKTIVVLHCQGGNKVKDKFIYQGMRDCIAANLVLGGHKSCNWGCLGFGTCEKVCPFGAIKMNSETGLPIVDESKCTGCGNCVNICPKFLFSLVPAQSKIYIACKSQDVGKIVMQSCGVGCIACRKCEKACPQGAIIVTNNLAKIDYSKCNGCFECVEACPTKVIIKRGG